MTLQLSAAGLYTFASATACLALHQVASAMHWSILHTSLVLPRSHGAALGCQSFECVFPMPASACCELALRRHLSDASTA